ncbi:hypothetical protein MVEN_01918900 [Mycena venus]|uniref:Uncharacterized protein n=1 Tax=Mycena venus TaxID=2733690 RepID=A0A8H6XGC4_9AGAR|nr:hypothetical protein MVEN_01918900 [Mycena venus]
MVRSTSAHRAIPRRRSARACVRPLVGSASMPDIRQQVPTAPVLTSAASISAGPAQKKRRVTGTAPTSIKLAPVATPTPPRRSQSPLTTSAAANAHSNSHKRSRLSRQIHPQELDMDAEGEEEGEGEDENLYCFCQKQSYGDMIACDNDDCPVRMVPSVVRAAHPADAGEVVLPGMHRERLCCRDHGPKERGGSGRDCE